MSTNTNIVVLCYIEDCDDICKSTTQDLHGTLGYMCMQTSNRLLCMAHFLPHCPAAALATLLKSVLWQCTGHRRPGRASKSGNRDVWGFEETGHNNSSSHVWRGTAWLQASCQHSESFGWRVLLLWQSAWFQCKHAWGTRTYWSRQLDMKTYDQVFAARCCWLPQCMGKVASGCSRMPVQCTELWQQPQHTICSQKVESLYCMS